MSCKSLFLGALGACLLAGAATATTLTSRMNVDNAYMVYISTSDGSAGTQFGSGANWPTTFVDTSPALTPGAVHYLHIEAWDLGAPAALLGEFTLSDTDFAFADGTQSLLSGSADLTVSKSGWGGYGPTTDRGANGVAPWGFQPGVSAAARWVWSDTTAGNDRVYFSATILPQRLPDAVPVPAAMGLLLTALGGLVLRCRRPAGA